MFLYISYTIKLGLPDSKVPPNKIVCFNPSDKVTTANLGYMIIDGKAIGNVADDIELALLIVKQ